MNKPYANRTHEEMKEVLMDPNASGPEIHYYMIRGGSEKKNITVWENGTVGSEYIKTYGHYHIKDFKETYTILQGQGIILIQMRKKDSSENFIDDEIESFKAIKLKAGDSIEIPAFSGHLLANTGSSWLVTIDDSPFHSDESPKTPAHADYSIVKKMHGFAYYLVEKEGKPHLVRNKLYKTIPPAQITEL